MQKYLLVFSLAFFGVNTNAQTIYVHPETYIVKQAVLADTAIEAIIKTYTDSLDRAMNKVVGFSVYGLYRKNPEGNAGDFVADAMRFTKNVNTKIDIALIDNNVLRSYIPKGDVTVGNIYKLIYNDDALIMLQVNGNTLKQLLDTVAARNGWPISGCSFSITSNKLSSNILVGDKALDVSAHYNLLTTKSLVQGKNSLFFLKDAVISQTKISLTQAVIKYAETLTEEGKSIDIRIEKRIIYGN